MKRTQSSITAEGIAFARALETEKPEGQRILNDPYARRFIRPWFWFLSKLFLNSAQRRSPGVVDFLVARARYMDDYLQTCLQRGLRQTVILGAGFDSRAYRIDGLQDGMRIFEVDHPATQQLKLETLHKIFGKTPGHVTYVPVDFNTQTLASRLLECGYSDRLKTLFIWEGVCMYLTAEAVDNTLAFVTGHAAPGSAIIFDYIHASALRGAGQRSEIRSMQRYRRFTGEGLIFGIPKGEVAPFLEQRGFKQVVDADSKTLEHLYYPDGRVVSPVYAIVHAEVP